MKLRSLRLEQFKKFDQAVLIEGFGDGLNLIAGPNETGKSTLLLALRAVLFERHGSTRTSAKDLAPHHVKGAKPTVTLDFEIAGKRYVLEKRFLSGPMARLETTEGKRFEGAEAEAELKRLLSLNPSEKTSTDKDSPAHFGVLLTPQTRSFHQPALADGTRHSLEAAIASDIAELGNQSEADGLLTDVGEMLFAFVSKRGEPKGRYKDISDQLKDVDAQISDLRQRRDELRQDVEALERVLADQGEIISAEDGEKLANRLSALEAGRSQAMRRQTIENRRLAACQQVQQLETKRAELQSRLEERQKLAEEIAEIEVEAKQLGAALETIKHGLAESDQALSDLGEKLNGLVEKRHDLEALGRELERKRHIDATLSALATNVRFDLDDRARDRLTINGKTPAEAKSSVQVTEGLTIEIEGVGRITVEPKTEPMQEALDAKETVESAVASLLEKLDLADAVADVMETLWQSTAAKMDSLEASRNERRISHSEEHKRAAEAKAALDAMQERRDRQTRRLAEIDAVDDGGEADQRSRIDALDAGIAEAKGAIEAAEHELRASTASQGADDPSALPLDRLDTEIDGLRARIEDRRRNVEEADRKVVALEASVAARAGFGLDERIDQHERRRHLLAMERDAFALDHSALDLLQKTLKDAADEAKATFNAPLSARLTPYIKGLFPEAIPLVTPDFSIRALDRNGVEEPFLHLSDGTREQIAILARLAFADMLQEQGLPALVVLDDALTFSDSARLECMFGMLEEAAKRMQIIILTCHEDRFAGLEAKRLAITPVRDPAISAA